MPGNSSLLSEETAKNSQFLEPSAASSVGWVRACEMQAIPLHPEKGAIEMADTNKDMNKTNEQGSSKSNTENMQREQGQSGQRGQGGFDKDRESEKGQSGQREQGGFDKDRQGKSAIGGGEKQAEKGQTSGQSGQFDKNRSEPTSR
jgi:hypothetical protein